MLNFLFGNKGKDIKALLYSSLRLLGERDVRVPSFRRLWLSAFNRLYLLCAVLFILYDWHRGLGILLIVAGIFFLFPLSVFYNVRMKACQTRIVYTTITRGSSSFREANQAVSKVKWSLRLFAVAELFIATGKFSGDPDKSQGILGQLARTLLSALETVFDVVEDYLLPAIVIEEKPISEVGGRLAALKNNVPAALTGAFGLDLFGDAVSSLTWFLHVALFACGVAAGFVSASYVPPSVLTPLPRVSAVPALPTHIFLVPILVCILISSLFNRTLKIFVSSLKDTYFSVFYTSLNRPLEIRQDLRESLTNYLNLQDVSYAQSVKTALAQKFPTLAAGPTAVLATEGEVRAAIDKVFQDGLPSGHSPDQIRDFLKTRGYADAQIGPIMEKYKKPTA